MWTQSYKSADTCPRADHEGVRSIEDHGITRDRQFTQVYVYAKQPLMVFQWTQIQCFMTRIIEVKIRWK